MVLLLTFISVLVGVVWLCALTVAFWRLSAHYNMLISASSKKTLQGILETLLADVNIAKKDIALLQKQCDTIINEGSYHIQKIGLLRFNPFKDTGGDQSFILALVDKHDTGIIISGLYSRSGTRWYAKHVVFGKGIPHELSEEEKQALKQATTLEKAVNEK